MGAALYYYARVDCRDSCDHDNHDKQNTFEQNRTQLLVKGNCKERKHKKSTSKSLKNKCVSAKLKIISSILSPNDTDVGGS